MNLFGLDLNLLLVMDALLEVRSVSAAARALKVKQPTLSTALAKLRAHFNDPLFVRHSGAMHATPFALRLAPAIRKTVADIRTLLTPERVFEPHRAERSFTIASTDYTSFVLLPAIVAAVAAHAPRVDLRVVAYDKADINEQLARGDVDVALGTFDKASPMTIRRTLFTERFVGVARPMHPVASRRMTAKAYSALPHALVSVRRDARGAVDDALTELGLTRRVALVVPHMLALPNILRTSDMVAAVPSRIADRLEADGLIRFALPIAAPDWRVQLLSSASTRTDLPIAWLRLRVIEAVHQV